MDWNLQGGNNLNIVIKYLASTATRTVRAGELLEVTYEQHLEKLYAAAFQEEENQHQS